MRSIAQDENLGRFTTEHIFIGCCLLVPKIFGKKTGKFDGFGKCFDSTEKKINVSFKL